MRFCLAHTFVFVLAFQFCACVQMKPKSEIEEDIRALAFWHLLNENPTNETYFLAISVYDSATGKAEYQDPTDKFMKRFANARSTVKKLSDSPTDDRFPLSRRPGRELYVGNIRWISDRKLTVSCSMICGPLCGYGHALTFQFTWQGWIMTEEGPRWIS